jgi:SAM-dependent methyltransferase
MLQDPAPVLAPYVREGMTVLEPGPGMGFFTLELARLVGPRGRVVAVDIQQRMLDGLKRRAARAALLDRIDIRLAGPDSLGVSDLAGTVDLALAFAVVHEMPDAAAFFQQVAEALKPTGRLLLVEPSGHVNVNGFEAELSAAARAGLTLTERPGVRRSHAALLHLGART